MPRRPSGADKKQKPAKKGRQRRSRNRGAGLGRSRQDSIVFAANQHCQYPLEAQSSVKTIDGWLPGPPPRPVSRRRKRPAATVKRWSVGLTYSATQRRSAFIRTVRCWRSVSAYLSASRRFRVSWLRPNQCEQPLRASLTGRADYSRPTA